MNNMKDKNTNITIELITRFLANETSQEENQIIDNWRKEKPENEVLFKEYETIWANLVKAKGKTSIDINQEWEKISTKIDNLNTSKVIRTKFNISRIAAIIAFFIISSIGAYFISTQTGYTKVITSAKTQTILLPDGSEVTLNAFSKLSYPKEFNDMRNVKLEGEAFFVVARDESKPFVISTSHASIKVLGTSFNVSSYKNKESIEVIVNTGKVSLSAKKNLEDKVILNAGDKGVLLKKKKLVKKVANRDMNFLSWKNQMSSIYCSRFASSSVLVLRGISAPCTSALKSSS